MDEQDSGSDMLTPTLVHPHQEGGFQSQKQLQCPGEAAQSTISEGEWGSSRKAPSLHAWEARQAGITHDYLNISAVCASCQKISPSSQTVHLGGLHASTALDVADLLSRERPRINPLHFLSMTTFKRVGPGAQMVLD